MIELLNDCDYFKGAKLGCCKALTGGLSNQTYLVECDQQKLVCRLQRLDEYNPSSEAIHHQVAKLKLAPEIIYQGVLADHQLTLLTYVEGKHLSANGWSPIKRQRFATDLASIHSLANNHWPTLELSTHIKQYLEQLGDQVTQPLQGWAKLVLKRLASVDDWPQTLGVCHNDLNQLNIISTAQQESVYIIDWDFAQVGDVFFDLAGFIVEHQLNEPQSAQFCQDYMNSKNAPLGKKLSKTEVKTKLDIYRQAYQLICQLWHCLEQQKN